MLEGLLKNLNIFITKPPFLKLCGLFICSIYIFTCRPYAVAKPEIQKGILDLSQYKFQDKEVIKLDGEWRFTPNEFVFANSKKPLNQSFEEVPGVWKTRNEQEEKTKNAIGFGSYELEILLPPKQNEIAFFCFDQGTSYRILIDGKVQDEIGKPGTNAQGTVPYYASSQFQIKPEKRILHLILHIANFEFQYQGGFWNSVYIGSPQSIQRMYSYNIFLICMLLGASTLIAVYHLGLFVIRPKEIYTLYFSIFCILIAVRSMFNYTKPINLFTNFNFETYYFIEYQTFYFLPVFFLLFLKGLFPEEFFKRILPLSIFIAIVLLIISIFYPVRIYSKFTYFYEVLILFYCLVSLVILVIAIFKKRAGARFIFIGFVVITTCAGIDIFSDLVLKKGSQMIYPGFLFFLLQMSFALAARHNIAYKAVETLAFAVQQNAEMEKKKQQLEFENSFKSKLFTIVSHDLKTPFQYLKLYFQMESNPKISAKESQKNRETIEQILFETNQLLENLLKWSSDQIFGSKIQIREFSASKELKTIVSEYNTILKAKKLTVQILASKNPTLKTDKKIFEIIIRNLLTNAIKFSPPGEKIKIHASRKKGSFEISVLDHGKGISNEALEALSSQKKVLASETGSMGESGTGLGLLICKELLEQIDGELFVSRKKIGTEFRVLFKIET